MEDASSFDPELFIYVMIPENIQPVARAGKYEDPIAASLEVDDLGFVSGGGSQMDDPDPDGTPRIAFCGLDIDVTDLPRSLECLRGTLPRLGVPPGTELHYTRSGERLLDRYADGKWQRELPREMLHPGFGI